MRRLKHLALFLMALLAVLTIVVFMLENQQPVIITLFGWSGAQVSASVCLMIALLVGMIIGPLLGMVLRSGRKVNFKRNI
jgi:putative membrane protein